MMLFLFVSQDDYPSITVKPALAITSIKQSHVLKGHLFLSCHGKFHMN